METEVMMLGSLGQSRAARMVGPRLTTSFLPPAPTTPQEPQNLLRQTVMNGLGRTQSWRASYTPRPALQATPRWMGMGRLALGGLGAGLQRTVAIGLGQVQGSGPLPQVWGDADRALLEYDIERGAVSPSTPIGVERSYLRRPIARAMRAGRAADVIRVRGLGGLGQTEEVGDMIGVTEEAIAVPAPASGIDIDENRLALGITWATISTVSALASLYHGYKRNNSLGWGLWWGLMGGTFPFVTPVVGYAQGWAKPRGRR